MTTYLYKAVVNEFNKEVHVMDIHLLADNYIQASKVAYYYVFESDEFKFDVPIEIVLIQRELGVKRVVNANVIIETTDEETPVLTEPVPNPFGPEPEMIELKHHCGCLLVAPNNAEWEFIECPECHEKVYRKDISFFAGIWILTDLDDEAPSEI